ncbi:MAG: glycine cleavage system protein GcvH [Chlamydiales bacterium]
MKFTKTHMWVKLEGEIATIGVTLHAQKELGDVVYVELPARNRTVKAGEEAVVVESTKAAVDLYFPLSGDVVEVNKALQESPDKINSSPEGSGWLFKLKISNPAEYRALLDEADYKEMLAQ